MSYVYNSKRSELMLASDSYITSSFVLAIPDGSPLTPFQRLIKPFRYIIWSCFSSSLLFAIVFIYSIRYLGRTRIMNFIYGQGNRVPFTNLLSTLFGGTMLSKVPYRNFARYLAMLWMLYTFVLRSAYSGELYKILQDGSTRNVLKTLDEVVENNYTIYAFGTLGKILQSALPKARLSVVHDADTEDMLFAKIADPNSKDKIALCTMDLSLQYYNQLNPTRRVQMLKQPVVTSPVIFYMPRHSYLRLRTNTLILEMLQSGLMKRFRRSILYVSSRDQRSQGEPLKLSFHLLFGIFCVYGVFLVICLLIFFLEISTRKSRYIKAFIDFINI